ncbi:hypothetical protein NEE10_02165 [Glaesserella parasuis]|nr:hypothetical protein NEE10_02165 [Glaesserella parasuis]
MVSKKIGKNRLYLSAKFTCKRTACPELIQADCSPENLAKHLSLYLSQMPEDVAKKNALKQRFMELHQYIQCDADAQAAQAVVDVLNRE